MVEEVGAEDEEDDDDDDDNRADHELGRYDEILDVKPCMISPFFNLKNGLIYTLRKRKNCVDDCSRAAVEMIVFAYLCAWKCRTD